jgi:hypothetical protein
MIKQGSGGDVDDPPTGRVRVLDRLVTATTAAGLNATVLLAAALALSGTIGWTPSA